MRTGRRRVSGHQRISWTLLIYTLFRHQLVNLLTYLLTYLEEPLDKIKPPRTFGGER